MGVGTDTSSDTAGGADSMVRDRAGGVVLKWSGRAPDSSIICFCSARSLVS